MIEWIKNLLISIFGNIIYCISCLIPANKNLWIFGAWFGEKYVDNSKYLFEYVNENHPEIRAVWVTRDEGILKLIREQGYEAYLMRSWRAYLLSFRAGLFIICNGIEDVIPYAFGRTRIVQMWHGTPLKKIVYDDKYSVIPDEKFRLFGFKNIDRESTIFIAASQEVKKRISSAFKASLSRVKVTGYPRNDVLISEKIEDLPIGDMLNKLKVNNSLGIYMPTFREEDGKLEDVLENIKDLNSSLKQLNTVLLIKLHYVDMKRYDTTFDLSNIIFLKDENINSDIYPVLSVTDYLITDYSSVYFDYLLMDKPMIFLPLDIEDYLRRDREFYYDYNEVTPGPKAKDCHELVKYIEESMKNPDKYREERKQMNKIFNKYIDDQSSKRVYEDIIEEIMGRR